MKKIILVLFFLAAIGSSIFLLHRHLSSSADMAETDQAISQEITDPDKKPDDPGVVPAAGDVKSDATIVNADLPVDEKNPDEEKSLEPAQKEKYQGYFQETEKAWNERMEEFFVRDSGLGPQKYETYQKMREGYDRDKMEAFEQHHEFMKAQYGKDYTYRPGQDETKFAAEVAKKYEKSLGELIGDENMRRYQELKAEFNDKLKKETDPEIGFMVMEF